MDNMINVEMLDFDTYLKFLKRGFIDFFENIDRTDKSIFIKKDYSMALGFLAQANSFVDSLKVMSLLVEDLDRSEFTELIRKFDVYNNEVKSNIFTEHSQQWSDIEYRSLIKACEDIGRLLILSISVPKVS